MEDKFFIYGRVGIEEWNWKQEGELIAMVLRKHPQTYVNFDSGKLMGMFQAIKTLKDDLEYEKTKEIMCKNCNCIVA